ncbi:recombinase B [Aphanothece hegewaldii CCALA 016]|uniref:Recombinase B n=1 Tax=Aphanothece hegewaldii CCALA 016 TaxID=2107694 RepID=A0A2T1LZP2_9CHRO|nr:TM0106 family RecB-like putative nuclease [Aphanothece hegewaldii]PSF37840.1 recombinase B [Aphanothece hegewaldii CCALA 016]
MLLTDALLLDYKRCQRRAFLNVYGNRELKDPERDFLLKLRQESHYHVEKVLLESFPDSQRPHTDLLDLKALAEATEALMRKGVSCIHQGVLLRKVSYQGHTISLLGTPHLLIKQPGQSKFGDWQYYSISIQLGRRPKPEYKLIAAYHADLLTSIQGVEPNFAQIILRRQNRTFVELDTWIPRMLETLTECISMLIKEQEPEVFISRQRCSLCHWHSYCYTIAQSQQHLSLVPGITPNRYESLQTLGVFTVEALASTSPHNLGELIGLEVASQLQQQAQSIIENKAFRKYNSHQYRPNIPSSSIELYFDIEAEPEQNLDYLLGVLLVDNVKNTQKFYPFLAENPEDEKLIWQEFLKLVTHYPHAPIFHFAEYEVETIKRLAYLYGTPIHQIYPILSRCVDLHQQVTQLLTLPVESYSLKSLANWIGFQWRDPGVSGDQCVCWYDQWVKTGDRQLLESILRYNEDDCKATYHLKNWMVKFLA